MRVKCPAQEHETMSPARAQTWTARSRVKHSNHEATVPPTGSRKEQLMNQNVLVMLTTVYGKS